MAFDDELQFESELINLLFEKCWEREVKNIQPKTI